MYKYTDYFSSYGRIMQFNKNKTEPIHRWYSFVEGYSKEFIKSIIAEVGKKDVVCLEPFSGSGTTALELQNMGIKCISFEVNPFMYLISRVKLYGHYSYKEAKAWYEYILEEVNKNTLSSVSSTFPTLYQGDNKKKWNLDSDVGIAVEKLRYAIMGISNPVYSDLFLVALAAILLDVSNLYRNGKCLSYKENWKDNSLSQEEVIQKFSSKISQEFLPDISIQEASTNKPCNFPDNYSFLYNGDCRTAIYNNVDDYSIDLVITSPPYLNSRDYTDTYMLELKALGFTKNVDEISRLRNKTLRSHVQVKWDDSSTIENILLQKTLTELKNAEKLHTAWSPSIIDMVRLYFVDIQSVFAALSHKVKVGGKVYFNVSNSAYFGIEINTIEICASIAEASGFAIIEIRKARLLKTSPQQKGTVDKLLEAVIVMERTGENE